MWFDELTGFREENPDQVRRGLELADGKLTSKANGRTFCFGDLLVPNLKELRDQTKDLIDAGNARTEALRGRPVRRFRGAFHEHMHLFVTCHRPASTAASASDPLPSLQPAAASRWDGRSAGMILFACPRRDFGDTGDLTILLLRLKFVWAEVTGIVAESVARQTKNELNTLKFKQLQRLKQTIDYQLGAVGQL